MQLLMESLGKPVSRDTLMLKLWENDSFVDENALSVGVARLRKKLDTLGLGDFIQTKKGLDIGWSEMDWIRIWILYIRSRWKPMLAVFLVAAPLF